MPTIYQRLQEYRKQPDSVEISKAKLKKIYNVLKIIYDRNPNKQPMLFVTSIEGDKTFEVRHYPATFTKMIDRIILSFAQQKNTAQIPIITSKERKKIPAKRKPIYSSRNMK